jgi:hypothetical protein
MEWATNDMHNHHSADCDECNLAACYLELRELAKAAYNSRILGHTEQEEVLCKALEE